MGFKSTLKIGSILNHWCFQDLGYQNEQIILLGIFGGIHCRVLKESSLVLIQHHCVSFSRLLYLLSLYKVFLSNLKVSYMDMDFHHIWFTQPCIHPPKCDKLAKLTFKYKMIFLFLKNKGYD